MAPEVFSDANWATASEFLIELDNDIRDKMSTDGSIRDDKEWASQQTHIVLLVKYRLQSFINYTRQPIEKWPRALCCLYMLAYAHVRNKGGDLSEKESQHLVSVIEDQCRDDLDEGKPLLTSIKNIVSYYGHTVADVFLGAGSL